MWTNFAKMRGEFAMIALGVMLHFSTLRTWSQLVSLSWKFTILYRIYLNFSASIMVAAIMNGREKEKEMKNWLADLNVDYEKARPLFDNTLIYFSLDFWHPADHFQHLSSLAKLWWPDTVACTDWEVAPPVHHPTSDRRRIPSNSHAMKETYSINSTLCKNKSNLGDSLSFFGKNKFKSH